MNDKQIRDDAFNAGCAIGVVSAAVIVAVVLALRYFGVTL